MSLWFALELNSILNEIAAMPCNENTYIKDISLHLSSADLFGSPRIVCLMAISEWMRYGPVLKSTHGVVVRSRSNLILNEIAHMSCNENTYIEDISLHLILFDLLGLSVIACRQLFLVKFSCNENTYIEVISLHLISFDQFGLPVIACRQLFWVKVPM